MNAIARAQLRSQRRASSLLVAGAAILATSLAVVLTIATSSNDTGGSSGAGPDAGPSSTIAELASSHGLAHSLQQAASLLGVIALAYMASVFAQDFSTGVIRNLLLREPRRVRLMLGKLLGQSAAVVVAAAIAGAIAIGIAYTAATVKGIDTSQWFGAGLGHSLGAWAGLIGSALAWGLAGAALGLLFRSVALAIGLGLAYAIVFENILTAVWNAGTQWLPGSVLTAIAGGGSITVARALAVGALYVALLAGVALTRFRHDDVTA